MKICKREDCPFHEVDDTNVIVSNYNHSAIIRPKDTKNEGHIMILPHKHARAIELYEDWELETLQKTIAYAIKNYVDSAQYNVVINSGAAAGQTVPHLHVHIVPRWGKDDNFYISWDGDNIK